MPEDFLKYQTGAHKYDKSLDAIHELFARNLTGDGIQLKAAFQAAGMTPQNALPHLAKITGKSLDELEKLSVPMDIANAAHGLLKVQQSPEWAEKIGGWIDWATQAFRDNVTLPFPAFWSRNHGSGQMVNLTSGLVNTPSDLAQYGQAYMKSLRLWKKPEQAVLDEVEALRFLGHGFEDTSTFRARTQGPLPANPLEVGATFREAGGAMAEKPWKADVVPGLRTARQVHQTALGTGAKVNQAVEWVNRMPLYLYLKEKGYQPLQAAQEVIKRHFDYSDLSPFERKVMRRTIPFYTFTRKMAALTADTLTQQPGGPMAQLIRATGKAREPGAILPDYLSQTLAIPFGQDKEGQKRYLAGFGFAHEQPLQYLGGGIQGAGMEALSAMNPLFKGPLEYLTGQSFFQRRPIEQLDPLLGRTIASATGRKEAVKLPQLLEMLASNSPASRYLSSLRTGLDPRKGLGAQASNLLSGMRIYDVPPRTQDTMIGKAASDLLMGSGLAKSFEKTYVPKEVLEGLPAGERVATQQYLALLNLLAKRASQRAKGEAVEPLR